LVDNVEKTVRQKPGGFLAPDRLLTSVLAIEADWLTANNFEALLMDIDNTLVSRETQKISPEIQNWVERLSNQGFKLFLVTNNWHRVVFQTAFELGLPILHKSMKPLPFNFSRALRKLGVNRQNAVVVGDQMMTDVLGARLAGLKVILVLPLAKADLPHTRLLRHLERLFLGSRQPEDISTATSQPNQVIEKG
jgi:HAD superfamily phosphatase (TIGR01668 family)